MEGDRLSCAKAREIDLVDYLYSLGHKPEKIRGNDYWYLSPFRGEKTPSFKVARRLNIWYDHGTGKGGNLVDFGTLFHSCSVLRFLQILEGKTDLNFSFHLPLSELEKRVAAEEKRITILDVNSISSPHCYCYLRSRKVEPDLANLYLKEVSFSLNKRHYTALAFRNNSGGYELRNEHFKGSSSPKDITLIEQENNANLIVFEGFFSFLSYLSLAQRFQCKNRPDLPEGHTAFLVLNSLSFFEKSRLIMEQHAAIHLFLDRDSAGLKATQHALSWSHQYKDHSPLYGQHKDLNDFLIHPQKQQLKQSLGRGKHF